MFKSLFNRGASAIAAGDRVRVKRGPFEGVEGVIEGVGKPVTVRLNIGGKSVVAEIPLSDMARLDS